MGGEVYLSFQKNKRMVESNFGLVREVFLFCFMVTSKNSMLKKYIYITELKQQSCCYDTG